MCVAVVLGQGSVTSRNSRNGGAHHPAAKNPPGRKLMLIILIILVFSCTPHKSELDQDKTQHMYSRELSATGIHTIIGMTTANIT